MLEYREYAPLDFFTSSLHSPQIHRFDGTRFAFIDLGQRVIA
jgi:hypothetical protein